MDKSLPRARKRKMHLPHIECIYSFWFWFCCCCFFFGMSGQCHVFCIAKTSAASSLRIVRTMWQLVHSLENMSSAYFIDFCTHVWTSSIWMALNSSFIEWHSFICVGCEMANNSNSIRMLNLCCWIWLCKRNQSARNFSSIFGINK